MYVNKHCHIFQFGNQKRGAKPVCLFCSLSVWYGWVVLGWFVSVGVWGVVENSIDAANQSETATRFGLYMLLLVVLRTRFRGVVKDLVHCILFKSGVSNAMNK